MSGADSPADAPPESVCADAPPEGAAADELLVSRLTEDLRSQIQSLVDTALHNRESIWT